MSMTKFDLQKAQGKKNKGSAYKHWRAGAFYRGGSAGSKRNQELVFTASFRDLLKANCRLCDQLHEGPCGWGGDEDPYLNTQESEAGLNYETSGFKAIEADPGKVTVTFNVYPSLVDAQGYYAKTLSYRLVQKEGAWLVDDIAYPSGTSAREMMLLENQVNAAAERK